MNELAVKMVGYDIPEISKHKELADCNKVFEIKNLRLLDNAENKINLEVNEGEILGVAGVDGNGQLELEEMIMGLKDIKEGEIFYKGQCISNKKTSEINKIGIGHIPSDRFLRAILPNMTLYENFLLGNQDNENFRNKGFVNYDKLKSYTTDVLDEFNVRYSDIHQNISGLSGGNQQKLVVAREIGNNNQLILAAQPSRGLDIGAMQFIHEEFIELRNNKKSIILISADLDEILKMSDRIAVLYKGEIMKVDKTSKFTKESLGLLMAGKRETNEVN